MCSLNLSSFHACFMWDSCRGVVLVLHINKAFSNCRIFPRLPRDWWQTPLMSPSCCAGFLQRSSLSTCSAAAMTRASPSLWMCWCPMWVRSSGAPCAPGTARSCLRATRERASIPHPTTGTRIRENTVHALMEDTVWDWSGSWPGFWTDTISEMSVSIHALSSAANLSHPWEKLLENWASDAWERMIHTAVLQPIWQQDFLQPVANSNTKLGCEKEKKKPLKKKNASN